MQTDKPILTITGSDPTSGSGIQADIKTISALGGYAVSAVTSVTVQNTLGIQQFYDLPADVVAGQIEAIVNDVEPQTVKVGMLRTVETVDVVVEALRRHRPQHVIYAPVRQSSQGEALMPAEVEQRIRQHLLPLCTLVIDGAELKTHGAELKTHGEVNLLASAVACYLNQGDSTDDALAKARQYLAAQTARLQGLTGRSSELYRLFVEQVEQHYRQASDVRYYADALNVGSSYLAQVTRRIGGRSPKAMIDGRIVAEAERLLRDTELTVQETAYELGFLSQAHFAKFFKKLKGMTPTEWRIK